MFARLWRKEAASSDDKRAGIALARTYANAPDWELPARSYLADIYTGRSESVIFPPRHPAIMRVLDIYIW